MKIEQIKEKQVIKNLIFFNKIIVREKSRQILKLLDDDDKLKEERKNYSKWRSRIEGVGNDGTVNSNNNFGSVGSYGATSSENYSSYNYDNSNKNNNDKDSSDSDNEKKKKKKRKKERKVKIMKVIIVIVIMRKKRKKEKKVKIMKVMIVIVKVKVMMMIKIQIKKKIIN